MVALRRRGRGRIARHGAGAWWHDHGSIGMAGDLAVDAALVMRAIGGEGDNWTGDLLEQGADLGSVRDVAAGRCRRDDPSGVGVRADVQLSPCLFRHAWRVRVPCFSANPSPAPHSVSPVLSPSRCTDAGAPTGRQAAVVPPPAFRPAASAPWRSPGPRCAGCPPRVVRGSAFQAAIAASVNQTVRLPRLVPSCDPGRQPWSRRTGRAESPSKIILFSDIGVGASA